VRVPDSPAAVCFHESFSNQGHCFPVKDSGKAERKESESEDLQDMRIFTTVLEERVFV